MFKCIIILLIVAFSYSSYWTWGIPQLLPFTVNQHMPKISWYGEYLFFMQYIGNYSGMYYSTKEGYSWSPLKQIGEPIWQYCEIYESPSLISNYQHLYFGTRDTETFPYFGIYMSDFNGINWSVKYLFYFWSQANFGVDYAAIPDSMSEIFFWANYGSGTLGIFWSNKVGGIWQEPIFLGSTINPPSGGHAGVPFVTPDGQRLYFSVEVPIDHSQDRIYYSDRLGETSWGPRVAILPSQPAQNPSVDMYGNLYFTNPMNNLHYWAPLINVKVEPTSLGNIKALYR